MPLKSDSEKTGYLSESVNNFIELNKLSLAENNDLKYHLLFQVFTIYVKHIELRENRN